MKFDPWAALFSMVIGGSILSVLGGSLANLDLGGAIFGASVAACFFLGGYFLGRGDDELARQREKKKGGPYRSRAQQSCCCCGAQRPEGKQ